MFSTWKKQRKARRALQTLDSIVPAFQGRPFVLVLGRLLVAVFVVDRTTAGIAPQRRPSGIVLLYIEAAVVKHPQAILHVIEL